MLKQNNVRNNKTAVGLYGFFVVLWRRDNETHPRCKKLVMFFIVVQLLSFHTLFCSLSFTSMVNFTRFYTEDNPTSYTVTACIIKKHGLTRNVLQKLTSSYTEPVKHLRGLKLTQRSKLQVFTVLLAPF